MFLSAGSLSPGRGEAAPPQGQAEGAGVADGSAPVRGMSRRPQASFLAMPPECVSPLLEGALAAIWDAATFSSAESPVGEVTSAPFLPLSSCCQAVGTLAAEQGRQTRIPSARCTSARVSADPQAWAGRPHVATATQAWSSRGRQMWSEEVIWGDVFASQGFGAGRGPGGPPEQAA